MNNFSTSTFDIVLSSKYLPVESDEISINQPKIFIWETEQIVALHLKKIFQKAAYKPMIIGSNDDIFSLLLIVKPELIIISSDLNSEILVKLIAFVKNLNTSLIVLSTQPQDTITRQLKISNSIYPIILKPFTEDELLHSISMCLNGKLNSNLH